MNFELVVTKDKDVKFINFLKVTLLTRMLQKILQYFVVYQLELFIALNFFLRI